MGAPGFVGAHRRRSGCVCAHHIVPDSFRRGCSVPVPRYLALGGPCVGSSPSGRVLACRSLSQPVELCERARTYRSEEHTSELQSRENLVCRLLLEKKNN